MPKSPKSQSLRKSNSVPTCLFLSAAGEYAESNATTKIH